MDSDAILEPTQSLFLSQADKELLALASCPSTCALTSDLPPIDVTEERMELHGRVLLQFLTHIEKCICENLASIAGSNVKIERHLKRLVTKELKGTGTQLAIIAQFLQAMVSNQVTEIQLRLADLFRDPRFLPQPLPDVLPTVEPPILIQPPFVQPPQIQPEPSILPLPEVIPPPAIEPPEILPIYEEPPIAIGGDGYGGKPSSQPPGQPISRLPVGPQPDELFLDLPREA